jgi:hypothetical protein
LPEVCGLVAGETVLLGVAALAVIGTTKTSPVVFEGTGRAGAHLKALIVRQLVRTATGRAVALGQAGRTSSRTSRRHRNSRLVITRDRHASGPAELPEVSTGATAQAVSARVAGQTVVGTGLAASVVVELTRRTRTDLLHTLVVDELEGVVAGRTIRS